MVQVKKQQQKKQTNKQLYRILVPMYGSHLSFNAYVGFFLTTVLLSFYRIVSRFLPQKSKEKYLAKSKKKNANMTFNIMILFSGKLNPQISLL